MELRKPPSRLTATFVVSGGGNPRTPEIHTRSGPLSVSRIVRKSADTSGLR